MSKKHFLKNFFILLSFIVIVACSTATPLPEAINIIPPSQDVSAEIAAFSGTWKGVLFSAVNVTLVVEKINSQEANVIHSWGESVGGPGGYYYTVAKVISNNTIEWGDQDGSKFTFMMNNDLNSLDGVFHYPVENYTFKAKMKRASLDSQ